jgi:hypothetical protein
MQQRSFTYKGRTWNCQYSEVTGHWVAVTKDPDSRIVGASWQDLIQELKVVDTSTPRMDAIAICDPLPSMGSKIGF